MDENLIHRYISESPFFDHTTKNGLTIDQARTNRRDFDVVNNRKQFEDELKRKKGDEYMIVGEPQQIAGERQGVKNGMWVVRKQNRDFGRSVDGRVEEELTTLGTYYLVGENMYQAPSVGDVVGNRLVAATTSLSKFFETASGLASFSPTAGYSYPQTANSNKAATVSASGSVNASPARSREGSIVPGAEGTDTQSLRSSSQLPESQHAGSTSTAQDTRLLTRSFAETLAYKDEFMDENPLLGEPGAGNLRLTVTIPEIKRRRAAEEAARAKEAQQAASKVGTPALKVEKLPSPPAVMTEAKAVREKERDKERRGSKIEKAKRKKSRPSVAPGTPLSATATVPPGIGGAGG